MDTNVSKARAALIFRVESPALHPSSTGLVIEKGTAPQFRDTENGDNE
jgi:hypothetical protein